MKKMNILIILLIILVTLIGIGSLMTNNVTNTNNFKNITLADGTTIGIPINFEITKPFSNYTESDGYYYTNADLESKDYGWVHIEYTHDPVETMMHSSNSTKANDPEHDGIYEFDVFDANGHKVMKITGSNPAIVEKIGKSVKYSTNHNNNNNTGVNTTVEKISNNDNQQSNNQQNNNQKEDITDKPTTSDLSKNTVEDDIATMKQSRDNGGHYSGWSDAQIEQVANSYHSTR